MAKANKSGTLLEDMIHKFLKTYSGIDIVKQYPMNDIFGTSKVDFKIQYRGKTFFIEAKNQSVAGSVDQKLPFYVENIRERKYPGHFVFILSGDGIRSGALSYLKRKQSELDFSIIDFDNIDNQLYSLLEHNTRQTVNIKVKPIIKWAGGKRAVMKDIKNLFPSKIEGNYYEPFCGGISVACELYNSGRFSPGTKVYLNDNIQQLIFLYEIIKEDPRFLMEELNKEKYIASKENYDLNKKRYNTDGDKSKLEVAALFLFLNKTCYNGMYRENREGQYNVPFSKKENVKLYEEDNLMAVHQFLKMCSLSCSDYKSTLRGDFKKGDVIYCDPPYYNTFSSYSKDVFGKEEHDNLSKYFYSIRDAGIDIAVSNSNEQYIRDIYHKSVIHEIPVKRIINSKADDRSKVIHELFIL